MVVGRSKEGLIYTALLAVDVVVIGLVVAWFAGWMPRRTTAESSHLVYGDTLPALTAKDINGAVVRLRPDAGAYHLIFLIDPNHEPNAEEKYRIDYLNILIDRYGERGLKALAILAGTPEAAFNYSSAVNLRFPVVADLDRSISRRLSVHDQGVGLILTEAPGIVRYAEFHEFPPRDLLRQLVEKYIVGQVQTKLAESNSPLLTPGQKLPLLMVRDVLSKQQTTLNPETLAGYSLLFFTADCSSCQFTRYLSWSQDFLIAESSKGNPVMGLFTGGCYRDQGVDEQILSWPAPIWLIEVPIKGLGDQYSTRHDKFKTPIVVRMGNDGTILTVEPLIAPHQAEE